MEIFELVLFLIGAVLISAVLDQFLPRVSLPLVQIALGVVIAVLATSPIQVTVDSELFLVLFIAPLLFDEAQRADKQMLWRHKGSIVSLAVGLVLLLVLVVGFSLHWLVPSIPLAAAFALGAALGPTDAVAVAALSKDIHLTERQETLLSGESLINDASGVVSFQFAIAAAVTGAFSLLDATETFLIDFFGGLALGAVIGLLCYAVLGILRWRGIESTAVHMTFEVLMPFITYLAAEHVGVSGILAVVAAGITYTLSPRRLTPWSSRMAVTSSNVWEVLSFIINGVVFVLLGMQLPQATLPTWNDGNAFGLARLIGLVIVLTLIVEGMRFLWLLGMDFFGRDKTGSRRLRITKQSAHDALVTTLAGPKGAVTLSIIFTIPYVVSSGNAFPQRDLLIFLASGVILLTLLLANFAVPVLSPKQEKESNEDDTSAEIAILRGVLADLREISNPITKKAVRTVSSQYRLRIARLRRSDADDERLHDLHRKALDIQEQVVHEALQNERVDKYTAQRCLDKLARTRRRLARRTRGAMAHNSSFLKQLAASISAWWRRVTFALFDSESDQKVEAARNLAIEAQEKALEFLQARKDDPDPETAQCAAILSDEHQAALNILQASGTTGTSRMARIKSLLGVNSGLSLGREERDAQADSKQSSSADAALAQSGAQKPLDQSAILAEVRAEALRMELDRIQEMRESGRINASLARALREDVYVQQMNPNLI